MSVRRALGLSGLLAQLLLALGCRTYYIEEETPPGSPLPPHSTEASKSTGM